MSVATNWGTTAREREQPFPCDRFLDAASDAYYRGVSVAAPAAVVFRWLCQLRVAPYSYDIIDNLGHRSPQQLTPGLDQLETGQSVMRVFDLVDFERDRHITIRVLDSRVFGDIAVSYVVVPAGTERCRLLAKLLVRHVRGPIGWAARLLFPWGDLIMMRRQLLNLKGLAEGSTP